MRASVMLAGAAIVLATPHMRALGAPARPAPLRVVGSRATSAPVRSWIQLFRTVYPDRPISAVMAGSALGANALAERRADIVPITRRLRPEERRLLADLPRPAMVPVGVGPRPGGDFLLYLARDGNGRATGDAITFARVALSSEGQAQLIASGYAPLPESERVTALGELARLASM